MQKKGKVRGMWRLPYPEETAHFVFLGQPLWAVTSWGLVKEQWYLEQR